MRDWLAEIDDTMLLMDGFDDCLIGYVEQFGRPPIALYDRDKVIERLMEDGMTDEEAYEFYDFNQLGAYMGESTPAFAVILKEE